VSAETKVIIDASDVHYKDLNHMIREAVATGSKRFEIGNACGQRYIGDGLSGEISIAIKGTPGNDLGAFMDGPSIEVFGNAQDGVGNTMNSGLIAVHGDAGDIAGHAMRGGRIYVKGSVGYRTGIHMKAYKDLFPVVIAGGRARDFLGEYMAGGLLVILGQDLGTNEIAGDFVGTGMHGGMILLRGAVDERKLGKEVRMTEPSREDMEILDRYLPEYCRTFGLDPASLKDRPFVKLYPYTHRPYGKHYAY
jgi:glutamate synthase domain-containing protein 3